MKALFQVLPVELTENPHPPLLLFGTSGPRGLAYPILEIRSHRRRGLYLSELLLRWKSVASQEKKKSWTLYEQEMNFCVFGSSCTFEFVTVVNITLTNTTETNNFFLIISYFSVPYF